MAKRNSEDILFPLFGGKEQTLQFFREKVAEGIGYVGISELINESYNVDISSRIIEYHMVKNGISLPNKVRSDVVFSPLGGKEKAIQKIKLARIQGETLYEISRRLKIPIHHITRHIYPHLYQDKKRKPEKSSSNQYPF